MRELDQIEDQKLAKNVLLGADGYIFLRNDRNNTMAQITGRMLLTGRALRAWGTLLELRESWFKQQGIKYFYLAAPCKECVYSDQLPAEIVVSESRPIYQLIGLLKRNSVSRILYPLDELKEARKSKQTYPKGDSHWNWYGAFIAYLYLMSEMKLDVPVLRESDIEFCDERFVSDLSSKIGLDDMMTRGRIKKPKARLVRSNNISNIGSYKVFENEDKSLPRAVLFRDSFSNFMTDYLAESFSQLVVVWQPNIDYSIIKLVKPDVVISQQAERFMVVVPDELHGSTNRGYVAGKIQSGKATQEQGEILLLP